MLIFKIKLKVPFLRTFSVINKIIQSLIFKQETSVFQSFGNGNQLKSIQKIPQMIYFLSLFLPLQISSLTIRSPPTAPYSQSSSLILINGNLQTPNIPTYFPSHQILNIYNFSQSGWAPSFIDTLSYNVQVDDMCSLFQYSSFPYCSNVTSMPCPNQLLELETKGVNQNYTYYVGLTSNTMYRLEYDWTSIGTIAANGFALYLNSTFVQQFYSGSCTFTHETVYFDGLSGNLSITFVSLGPIDDFGMGIDNLNLFQLTFPNNTSNSTQQVSYAQLIQFKYDEIAGIMLDESHPQGIIIKNAVDQNGILRLLLGYVAQFNHFPLYQHHNRNYTINTNAFLKLFSTLDQQKTALADNIIFPALKINISNIGSHFSKPYYANTTSLSENFFFGQMIYFILYDTIIQVGLYFLLRFLFKILFKHRISIIFRKYAFNGYLIIMLYDGKIQTLTFYFLKQITCFNFHNFPIKIIKVCIILFYLTSILLLMSCFYFFMKFYKKSAKILFQDVKPSLQGCRYLMVSLVFFNFLLGFIHFMLLSYPQLQICTIIFLEVIFCIFILTRLIKKIFKEYMRSILQILFSLIRIILAISYILVTNPEADTSNLSQVLNISQYYLFFIYVIVFVLSIILDLIFKLIEILKIIYKDYIKGCISNKVQNVKEESRSPHAKMTQFQLCNEMEAKRQRLNSKKNKKEKIKISHLIQKDLIRAVEQLQSKKAMELQSIQEEPIDNSSFHFKKFKAKISKN